MNTRTPKVDVERLINGKKNVEDVLKRVTMARQKAEKMLEDDLEALDKDRLNIDLQGQVLKLEDYITKQVQNECSLADQITELDKTIAENTELKEVN